MRLKRASLAALLCLFFFQTLHANVLLRNDLLNRAAVAYVTAISDELTQKTGIHAYILATNEHFPVGFNLVKYAHRFDANMTRPYVVFIFAPYAQITQTTKQTGRVALVASSQDVARMYRKEEVYADAVGIVAKPDKDNTMENKYMIGIVQGYSTLADQIAQSHGVTLKHTIKESRQGLWVLQALILAGAALVFWIFLIRPLLQRKRQ